MNPVIAPAEPASLRERKKAATRAALIDVSQRRFAEHGYAATTLEEISEEVGVRAQTLLRYFESKAHLALAPMTDALDALELFLVDPHRELDTLTAWREYLRLESAEMEHPTSPAITSYVANLREFRRWADLDPVLVAMVSDVDRRLRNLLARELARDRGVGADDLHSALLAALLTAGRMAVYERWLDADPAGSGAPDSLLADHLAVVDYAVEHLPPSSADQLP